MNLHTESSCTSITPPPTVWAPRAPRVGPIKNAGASPAPCADSLRMESAWYYLGTNTSPAFRRPVLRRHTGWALFRARAMRYVHRTGCRRHRKFGSMSNEFDRVKAIATLAFAIGPTDVACCDRNGLRQFQVFAYVIFRTPSNCSEPNRPIPRCFVPSRLLPISMLRSSWICCSEGASVAPGSR